MKVIVDRAALLAELRLCSAATAKKESLPILSHVLIEDNGIGVNLRSTDTYMTAMATVAAQVERTGSLAVDADTLAGILRSLGAGDVALNAEAGMMTIESGSSRFQIFGRSADDFPSLPGIGDGVTRVIATATLQALIDGTAYAGTSDDSRCPKGIALNFDGSTVRAFGFDGYRIARVKQATTAGEKVWGVLSLRACKLLGSIAKGEDDVTITFGAYGTLLTAGERTLIVRREDVGLPNFDRRDGAFPDDATPVLIGREDLLSAAQRALAVSSRTKMLRFSFEKGALNISARTERGTFRDTVATDYAGKPVVIGINGSHLSEALTAMGPAATITFELHPEKSCVIRREPSSPTDEQICLIAPMNLGEK